MQTTSLIIPLKNGIQSLLLAAALVLGMGVGVALAQPRIVVDPDSLFLEAEQRGDWNGNGLLLNINEFNVFNRGNQRLVVDSICYDWDGLIYSDDGIFSLNAGQNRDVVFEMVATMDIPAGGVDFNFSFYIYSNDPENACTIIPVNMFAWHGQNWGPWAYSPAQHSVILTGIVIDGRPAPRGYVVTFITHDDQWAGGGTWLGHNSELVAYGNFQWNEGFYEQGEQIRFQLYDPLSRRSYEPTVNLARGSLRFAEDGNATVSLLFERQPFHILTITDVSFNDEPVPNGWYVVVRTWRGVQCTSGYWRNGRHLELVVYGEVEEYPGYFHPGEQMHFYLRDWRNRLEYPAIAVIEDGNLEFENGASSVLSLYYDDQPFHTLRITAVSIDDSAAIGGVRLGIFTPGGVFAGGWTWPGEQLDILVWGANDDHPDFFNEADSFAFRIFDSLTGREIAAVPEVEEGHLQWHEGGLTVLSLAGHTYYEHCIPLREGWNLLSSVCPPADPAMPTVWADVVGRGNLFMTKNQSGQFYRPGVFNNMAPWDVHQGYMAKLNEADTLVIVNVPVAEDTPIPLRQGWNMVAYFPEAELDVRDAFANIIDDLIIAKNINGQFYIPARGFTNMNLHGRGNGYQVCVRQVVELVYPVGERFASVTAPSRSASVTPPWVTANGRVSADDRASAEEVLHFQPAEMTGSNMSVLLTALIPAKAGIQSGEIGAFTANGLCVGNSKFVTLNSKFQIGLTVWADDPTTPEIDGAVEGEALGFRLWDGQKELNVKFRMKNETPVQQAFITSVQQASITPVQQASPPVMANRQAETPVVRFAIDGFAEATLDIGTQGLTPLPSEFALYGAFPNPFNSTTTITFSLSAQSVKSVVKLSIYDLSGRLVSDLVDRRLEAGEHKVVWDAGGLPGGMYLLRLASDQTSRTVKMVYLK